MTHQVLEKEVNGGREMEGENPSTSVRHVSNSQKTERKRMKMFNPCKYYLFNNETSEGSFFIFIVNKIHIP